MIKAVIFDLDGTLLNTLDDLKDSVNYVLEEHGYKIRTIDEIRNFVGNGVGLLIRRALPSEASDDEYLSCLEDFKQYYAEHSEILTAPYEGINDMLSAFKSSGLKIAVVSNKVDFATKALCKKYFGDNVDFALGECEGIRRKPAPDMVLKALSEMGLSSSDDVVYVGDSDVDIETARNSKIPCISVTWGFRDRDFLTSHGATCFADNADQLVRILLSEGIGE